MIRAMSCAREMNTRCPAGSSVTCAFIRFAMKRSSSGLIARSCVPTTYHDGTVFQAGATVSGSRSEEHTSELQSLAYLVCRLLLEKKKDNIGMCLIQLQVYYSLDVFIC